MWRNIYQAEYGLRKSSLPKQGFKKLDELISQFALA